jgi:CRISPR-associated protein Csm1
MKREVYNVTIGALLHDIGKLIHRTVTIDSRSHSISGKDFIKKFTADEDILNSIQYHHKQEITGAKLAPDSTAYVVYVADNISSGLDRREIEGEVANQKKFEKNLPLATVFNLLNDNNGKQSYQPFTLNERKGINYPEDRDKIINWEHLYNQIYQDFKEGLGAISFEPAYLNSVLELCEAYLSYLPSSTMQSQVSDISLYDHQKTTAALAACIYLYLSEQERTDFKQELLVNEKKFCQEKAFLMISCDISGIQQFIYTISSKGALKGLRARSFYLEIMMEHLVDVLLIQCGLSRANLIYTGGGHAYLLLPNTREIKSIIEQARITINHWLIDHIGNTLFLAFAFQECSAAELMNQAEDNEAYQNIFRSLSAKISQVKLQRYGAQEIRMLNSARENNPEGRECVICGTVDHLLTNKAEEDICQTCLALQEISREIIKDDIVFLTTDQEIQNKTSLELPSMDENPNYLYAIPEDEAKQYLQKHEAKLCLVYGKNRMMTGFKLAAKIWMGDYTSKGKDGIATFEELASRSAGIERIAVLRADVDNLGSAFVSGFVRKDKDNNKYVTLSRTTTLSRQLSIFFKYYINEVMRGNPGEETKPFTLGKEAEVSPKNLTIIYAGGDDVFLVGAWNEVIEAAVDLRKSFKKFSGGTLSLSAGIGIYTSSYPLSRMAFESEKLEQAAKNQPLKNAVSLFGEEMQNNQLEACHTYSWEVFENQVVGEKLRLLQAFFSKQKTASEEGAHGVSLLYNLMYLIRGAEKDGDRINIARFAYLLGRMAPDRKDNANYEKYQEFSQKMYTWILKEEDRKQLLTAILIHTYLLRKKEE